MILILLIGFVQSIHQINIDSLFVEKESSNWALVTPIWRKWADRFYPALTDAELEDIALRTGNEKAFNLVNKTPLEESIYIDEVNGVVSNRYYYRIRLQNSSLAESTKWSELSEPIIPPPVTPPRRPVFTKIETGDRKVTIHWALNRDTDLEKYILYRSESKEELEDLRWWEIKPDPRIISVVPDPRLKVINRTLKIPGSLLISEPIGVYRADEFNFDANPIDLQAHALNYYSPNPLAQTEIASTFIHSSNLRITDHEINDLRRIENGTDVVVIYRNNTNEIKILSRFFERPPIIDNQLVGFSNYFYRLKSVNFTTSTSEGSEIISAMPTDSTIPDPPEWHDYTRINETDGTSRILLAWIVFEPNVRCIVQRRSDAQSTSKQASGWLYDPVIVENVTNQWLFSFEDTNTFQNTGYTYRIKIESRSGNVNNIFNEVYIPAVI